MQPQSKPSIAVPIAIVCGFALIAAAILFSGSRTAAPVVAQKNIAAVPPGKNTARPVDDTDAIRGNPNAPIKVIEYSDYDCPFCKEFDDTMNHIMKDYGVSGKVAWIYRQFPIAELHPNAPKISEGALCVKALGGTEAFWKFSDTVFASRGVDEKTNMTRLPEYAEKAGVSRTDFNTCFNSSKFKDAVDKSIAEATAVGAEGTPYSIIVVGDQQAVINGAQPYSVVKQIIDNLVKQLDNSDTSVPAATGAATTTTQ
jgi:protein-disulfide isomerase